LLVGDVRVQNQNVKY
jgi:hypothetical protein